MRIASSLTLILLCLPQAFERTSVVNDVLVETYPPFGFIDSDNQLAGFDVDVAKAFAAKLGVKLKLATPGWETIVSGRWRGARYHRRTRADRYDDDLRYP
jgi:ABC-type amino acid transport substrate-binding protein